MNTAPPSLDAAVEAWFAGHGLTIHQRHYQFDYEFYAWRHTGDRRVFTLWVSELTAEDYEPSTIVAILRDIDPNGLMESYRHVHAHVTSNESEFGVHVRSTFSPTAV